MEKKKAAVAASAFGITFILGILALAIFFPEPTPFQYTVFRIVLALASAGVATVIPGLIDVKVGEIATASGAIAVFLIVYFFSPAELAVAETPDEKDEAAVITKGDDILPRDTTLLVNNPANYEDKKDSAAANAAQTTGPRTTSPLEISSNINTGNPVQSFTEPSTLPPSVSGPTLPDQSAALIDESNIRAVESCSEIGVVTYDGSYDGENNTDAARIAAYLTSKGYSPKPIHQWEFRDQSPAFFTRFDLVVLTNAFAQDWNPSALVSSDVPVIIMNAGYVDEFRLGTQRVMHERKAAFEVIENGHRITSDLPRGTLGLGPAIWTDAIDATSGTQTLIAADSGSKGVLVVGENNPYVWFGWYRLSIALSDSVLFTLLARSVRWACGQGSAAA